MDENTELGNRIEELWNYFHNVTSDLEEKEYTHLEMAGLMMAYSLKLYRMKLDDRSYQGMLNYIFQQHSAMMNQEKLPTLH
jgi:hypothetical protein